MFEVTDGVPTLSFAPMARVSVLSTTWMILILVLVVRLFHAGSYPLNVHPQTDDAVRLRSKISVCVRVLSQGNVLQICWWL